MATARINGFDMYYRERGDGPPLVLVHGLLNSTDMADALGETPMYLADRFRLINYDSRGHGRSGYTTNPADYIWDALADDLHELLRHLGIRRTSIWGGSVGGGTALVFALHHPEMVERLILRPPPPIGQQASAFSAQLFGGLALLIEGLGLEKAVDIALALRPWVGLKEASPELFNWIRDWLLSKNPEAVVPAIRGIVLGPELPHQRFHEIKAPTLIVAHPGDDIHPLASAEVLHEAIEGSRLVVAPSMVHYQQHPEELAAIVEEFLSEEVPTP
jgi:pimeloyl-ACP methyl ester carboxylesterase